RHIMYPTMIDQTIFQLLLIPLSHISGASETSREDIGHGAASPGTSRGRYLRPRASSATAESSRRAQAESVLPATAPHCVVVGVVVTRALPSSPLSLSLLQRAATLATDGPS